MQNITLYIKFVFAQNLATESRQYPGIAMDLKIVLNENDYDYQSIWDSLWIDQDGWPVRLFLL